ncbi:MAG: ADP-ribosylation factor-like protein [Chloroflexota bacterium]
MTAPSPPQRRRRRRPQRAKNVKIIVTGLSGSGKTSFIERVSQYTETEGSVDHHWFFGRVRVDSNLILHFYEPPMEAQFDFMWLREVMQRIRATGFIIMVDSARPQQFGEFLSILYTIRGYHEGAPIVVAANKQDHRRAWHHDDIRLGLGIRDVSVMPCVTSSHNAVRDVVVELLYQVRDM